MKICKYCGTEYEESYPNQQVCKKCFLYLTGRTRTWGCYTDIAQREWDIRKEWMSTAVEKNDRIVGEGYAKRQIADTLSRIEKIKTEL